MFVNILLLLIIIGIAILFGWLTRKAWAAGNPFIKWGGSLLSAVLLLITGLVAALGTTGLVKAYTPSAVPVPQIQVEGTPEKIARGQHLAAAFCSDCHSLNSDFPLTGGRDLALDLSMPLGKFVSVNLTPAGPLKDWTDGEIFRAIRDGVDKDGKPLVIMSGINVRYMSDEDMLAVIAFLRSQEAVENETLMPPDQPSLLAFILSGANLVPQKPAVAGPITAPQKGSTVEYGRFMVSFLDCTDCHGADLSGGTSNISPNGPSLRVVKGWTEEQFITTLRTGVNPGGDQLDPPMPWKTSGRLDDTELGALYAYLTSLP